MKIIKIKFIFLTLFFFNGCVQTVSLLGPSITAAATGNVMQAGLQYGANTAIKNETGKDTFEHLKDVGGNDSKNKKLKLKFSEIVKNRIQVVKEKLSRN
jgi:hypothetical protein